MVAASDNKVTLTTLGAKTYACQIIFTEDGVSGERGSFFTEISDHADGDPRGPWPMLKAAKGASRRGLSDGYL